MARLTRFLHPYYVVNFALVLSWAWLRSILDISKLQSNFMGSFVTGELALTFSMTLYLYKKFKRCNTWDSFISKTFVFYQALIVFMLFYVSVAAMIWYILACVLVFFIFRPPSGGKSPYIVDLDDITFEAEIMSKEKNKDVAWLVFFAANWHTECTFFSYVFAEMADAFGGTNKLRFGRLDDRYKSIFDKHKVTFLLII